MPRVSVDGKDLYLSTSLLCEMMLDKFEDWQVKVRI
jgi:hypothetical protein